MATKKTDKTAPKPSMKTEKVYTFDQWAARRPEIKETHKAGLRAFVKNVHKKRTLEQWDACFTNY